jgi:23S rRNA (cytidine1920-2'-O)/16S rRNA (cytidine1409-2'-O)-methyltransferase
MKRIPLLSLLKLRFPDVPPDELYARVLCGEVSVDGERVIDPKKQVKADTQLKFRKPSFVSRGGEKLDAAIERLGVRIEGLVFLDAGASTGGFTDALLSRGAAAVHAVDVGYNQLAYSLRENPRVFVHERTNIMALTALDPVPDAAVADLSFRSLRGAAAHLLSLVRLHWALVLFKPQFEKAVTSSIQDGDFRGLVKSDEERLELLRALEKDLLNEGVQIAASVESPIAGKKKGNREIVLLIHSEDVPAPAFDRSL